MDRVLLHVGPDTVRVASPVTKEGTGGTVDTPFPYEGFAVLSAFSFFALGCFSVRLVLPEHPVWWRIVPPAILPDTTSVERTMKNESDLADTADADSRLGNAVLPTDGTRVGGPNGPRSVEDYVIRSVGTSVCWG